LDPGEARDELIVANMGLARMIARRFHGKGTEDDDLEAEAYLQLVRTAVAHDDDLHSSGSFRRYAEIAIFARLIYLTGQGRQTHFAGMPRELRRAAIRCHRAREVLMACDGREPSIEAIAAQAKIPFDVVRKALSLPSVSVHADLDDYELVEGGDPYLLDEDGACSALDQCKATERRVLILALGLDGSDPLSFREIGQKLGIETAVARRAHDAGCLTIARLYRERRASA
jgi:DNA-directed RNA polymerase specialized sigma subunit